MPEFSLASWLEWQSFGLILLSTWLYGKSKRWGAAIGIVGSLSFFAFGYVADLPAAIVANLVFVVVHCRNLWIATVENSGVRHG